MKGGACVIWGVLLLSLQSGGPAVWNSLRDGEVGADSYDLTLQEPLHGEEVTSITDSNTGAARK